TPRGYRRPGSPEQSTCDEWKASAYAVAPVPTTQFGGNLDAVSTCQDCHMPPVTGHDGKLAPARTNVPHPPFAGANAFILGVLPRHPAFGADVDAAAVAAG